MGCDFKPGDELVSLYTGDGLKEGHVYVCASLDVGTGCTDGCPSFVCCSVEGLPDDDWCSCTFRKVERRNDSLSIEAFLTIKPGFEEPKRKAPAKKREKTQ
jgi:hypothetical protein